MATDSLCERDVPLNTLMPLIREELSAGKSVRFSPRGVSMLPMLRPGVDTVTISPPPEKLVIGVGETYICLGDNQFGKEYGVRHDQIIGLVTEFTRGKKKISVTAWQYRLYCRFWAFTRFPRRCLRKAESVLRGWIK